MSGSDPIALFEELLEQQAAPLIQWLLRVRRRIDEELRQLRHHHPRQITLLPQYFTNLQTGAVTMPDIQLPLNQSYTEVIELTNAAGTVVPVSSTDTFTATVTDTVNMQATVAPFVPPPNATAAQTALAGQPAVTVQWLFSVTPPLTGVGVTITDSAGNTSETQLFDMAAAVVTPDQITVDTNDAVFTTIATPPAGA
jgi:AcrR family transcriptional regulator